MPAHKPEECNWLLITAIEGGDLDAAVSLYEPDASFVLSPDQVVSGHHEIRRVMHGFVASKTTFRPDAVTAIPSADGSLAVTRVKGAVTRVKGSEGDSGPGAKPVTTPIHSVEVVRKQPDGTWRFVIGGASGEFFE